MTGRILALPDTIVFLPDLAALGAKLAMNGT